MDTKTEATTDEAEGPEASKGPSRSGPTSFTLLRVAAHNFTHCLHDGHVNRPECMATEGLRVASLVHVNDILKALCKRRSAETCERAPHKASPAALAEVINELNAVVDDMLQENTLMAAVHSGEAADC